MSAPSASGTRVTRDLVCLATPDPCPLHPPSLHRAESVIKDGRDDTQLHRQRYLCHGCPRRFDDLTGTIFAGHHQPLRTSILCLEFMGLNLSSLQIAKELDMDRNDVQAMVQQLRQGIVDRRPAVVLEGEVECDEVDVVAGHKDNPEAVKKRATRATPSPEGRA